MRTQIRTLPAIRIRVLRIFLVFLLPVSVPSQGQNTPNPDLEPLVSVTANGSRNAEVFRGMPLVLTTVFVHPDPFTSAAVPLTLSAGTPPWTNAVTLSVLNSNGIEQPWPWHFASGTNTTLSLVETNYEEIVWWLDPTQTPALPSGVYTIQVTLNTTNATTPAAWKGVVESVPVQVVVTNEPASLSEEQSINKFVQLALFAGRQQNPQEALNHTQTLLARYPTNLAGMTLKAAILNSMGQLDAALAATSEALSLFDLLYPLAQEMPGFLLDLRDELQASPVPGLRLSVKRSGQQLTVSWLGDAGTVYRLQLSLNLQDWSDLAATPNFDVTGSTFTWTTNITAAAQFFRVGF